MLIRRKHSLDRLLALNASGDPMGSFTPGAKPNRPSDVGTLSVWPSHELFIFRYRLQGFKVGAEVLGQSGMIVVI
jgi:hypothetical protein